MTGYRRENERMLAAVLGVDHAAAAQRLDKSVAITCADNSTAMALATELKEQLERTVHIAGPQDEADLEVAIGCAPNGRGPQSLSVGVNETALVVQSSADNVATVDGAVDGLRMTFAGCYAAAPVLHHLIGLESAGYVPEREPFIIKFAALGIPHDILNKPIRFEDAGLAGAGAIGNGFLRALRHLPAVGSLAVIDPKHVGLGNPNRCLYFAPGDEGAQKALLLAERAKADFPSLQLRPHVQTFGEFARERGRVRRAIVATDSRRVRRSIQSELPWEVIDASTTDIREIIVYSHRQPTGNACLACIYRHIPEEQLREKEIARGLGIAPEDVAAGLITQAIAAKIVLTHPDLLAHAIEGMAFDSLFKQRCAEQQLPNAVGTQVLAPFAFVSNLAGAFLALEIARIDRDGDDPLRTNYFFLSPWSPPNVRARSTRPRDQGCEFCARPQTPAAIASLWADKIGDHHLEVV